MNGLNIDDLSYRFKNLFLRNSKPRKILFEHVPKCGGTTVVNYLKSQYSNDKIFNVNELSLRESIDYFKSLPKKERYSYDLIYGHGAHKLKDYVHPKTIKFTILRNPIDRIISHYYYVLRTPKHYLYNKVITKEMSLMDYVSSNISDELQNSCVQRFSGMTLREIEKDPDKSIEEAYNVLKNEYSVVGILENFNQTMELVAKKAFFNKKFEVEELNKTTDRPKKKEIDELTLKTIKKINSLDIKLYDLVKNDLV